MARPTFPRPPSVEWQRALAAAATLRDDDACHAHGKLVAAVRGTEGRKVFDALVASVRVRHDHGLYEGTHNAIWRFPQDKLGRWMAQALPAFQKRMGRHDQVHRFYGSITNRRRARTAFIAGVNALPASQRRAVIALLRRWSREVDEWEPVLAALGAPVAKAAPAATAPPTWPKPWRDLLAEVRAGTKDLTSAWGATGQASALPRVIAFMTIDHGPLWREIDWLSNPLFVSYAKPHYPTFVKLVGALPADERARLLANLGKAAPRKRQQLETDLRATAR